MTIRQSITLLLMGLSLIAQGALAESIGFDDLTLAPDSYFDPDVNDTFVSGDATFVHSAPFGACCWGGFTYSNRTDQTTADFTNDTSAYQPATGGGGALGTTNFGVAFGAGFTPRFDFSGPVDISDAYFTNNTYAALSMRDGDSFAKKFGGISGDEPDFFKLIITGKNAADEDTGVVEFYLADFRGPGIDDYIVDEWTNVDLSPLGIVSALVFGFESSDVHPEFGINTPQYFAIDEISFTPVPVPAAFWLFASALVGILRNKRDRLRLR